MGTSLPLPMRQAEVVCVCKKSCLRQYLAVKNCENKDVGCDMIFHAYFASMAWFISRVLRRPRPPNFLNVVIWRQDFQCMRRPSGSAFHTNRAINLSYEAATWNGSLKVPSTYCGTAVSTCLARVIRPGRESRSDFQPCKRLRSCCLPLAKRWVLF